MGRVIVKVNEYLLEWSSILDAPTTFGMNREEFEAYYRDEYGSSGHRDFEKRMARVEKTGTSNYYNITVGEIISGNRAGPNESELTFDEIYQAYCLQKPIRNGWLVREEEQ
jgi:hypothetical protein